MKNIHPMVVIRVTAIAFAILASAACQAAEKQPRTISVADFNRSTVEITGLLGLKLGTFAEIEAMIVDGASLLGRKDLQFAFLLSVEKVNGKQLPAPLVIQFQIPFRNLNLVVSYHDLPKVNDRFANPPKPSDEEFEAMKRRYVGSRYKLAVYETGIVGGHPDKLTDDIGPWANFRPYFHTYLEVLAIR